MYELYYDKKTDTIQFYENGVLKSHDECVDSCEFYSYFGEEVECVEDMKKLPIKVIKEGYAAIRGDFEYHSPLEAKEHVEWLKTAEKRGELVTTWVK